MKVETMGACSNPSAHVQGQTGAKTTTWRVSRCECDSHDEPHFHFGTQVLTEDEVRALFKRRRK